MQLITKKSKNVNQAEDTNAERDGKTFVSVVK